MSDIGLDLSGLAVALGLVLACALLATPAAFALARGLAGWRRALLALLAGLGVAGALAVPAGLLWRDRELAPFVLAGTAILQVPLLLLLLLLTRKG